MTRRSPSFSTRWSGRHGHSCIALLIGFASVLPPGAQAHEKQPCDAKAIEAVGQRVARADFRSLVDARSSADNSTNGVVAAACKAWPDDERLMAVAVAHTLAKPVDAGEKGIFVGLLHRSSGQWSQVYQTTVDEDAALELSASSLSLDTGRYHLASGVRAFGYVVHSSARGASCPDGGANDELTLLVPEGASLRPVLNVFLSQWATLAGHQCNPESAFVRDDARLALEVGRSSANGMADLVVVARVDASEFSDPPSATARQLLPKSRVVRQTARYDGRQYAFDAYSDFWMRRKPQ